MPQTPTPNMGLIKPTENGDDDVWDLLLDAMFDLLDQHDHSTGKGVKVPLATGSTVTADIPWSSDGNFYAITNLKAIDFQPLTTGVMAGYAGALFVNSANNELTWRTTGGANVQLTNGTTLNVSLTGTIGGDYASVGALIDFTDTTDTYALRQQIGAGVRQFARLQTGDMDLYEYKAQPAAGVPANRVRHKSPASLAASYDLTWLTALPGAATPLQVDNTGAITASNTFAQGATAAANQHFRVSGTGEYKFSSVIQSFPVYTPNLVTAINPPTFDPVTGDVTFTLNASTTAKIYVLLPGVQSGWRVTGGQMRGRTSNGATWTIVVKDRASTSAALVTFNATVDTTSSFSVIGAPFVINSGSGCLTPWLEISATTTTGNSITINSLLLSFDLP